VADEYAIYDSDPWLAALSGPIGISRQGDHVRAHAVDAENEWSHPYHLRAHVEFRTAEKIGHACLKLHLDRTIGFVVLIEYMDMRPGARGLGIGSAIVAFWADAFRFLGIKAMYFDAVYCGRQPSGRTFWARDGVLFRDPDVPARLLQARFNSLTSRAAREIQPEPSPRPWWQRLLRRQDARRPTPPVIDSAQADALQRLKERIDAGESLRPADLYADPCGRQLLAANDWRGWWPLGE